VEVSRDSIVAVAAVAVEDLGDMFGGLAGRTFRVKVYHPFSVFKRPDRLGSEKAPIFREADRTDTVSRKPTCRSDCGGKNKLPLSDWR
jgi:hypothetical protein